MIFKNGIFFSFLKYSAISNLEISKCPNLSKILHPIRTHEMNFFSVFEKNVFASFIMKHTVFMSTFNANLLGENVNNIFGIIAPLCVKKG